LTALARNAWNTLAFDVPPDIQAAFHQVRDDVRFAIELNLASCSSSEPTFRLDHLRFAGDLAERSLCDDGGTGTGGNGGTGTGGTGGTGTGGTGTGGTGTGGTGTGGTGTGGTGTGGTGTGGTGGTGTGGTGTGGTGTGGTGTGGDNLAERIFSFDDPSLWSSLHYTPSSDTQRVTQGSASLTVAAGMWLELWSVAFDSREVPEVEALSFDLYIPTPPAPQSWGGQVDVFVDCPSAGLWTQYVGSAGLGQRSWNAFNTLVFTVPQNVRTALSGSYTDCRLRLTINSWGSSGGPMAIDHLRFHRADFCTMAQLSNAPPFVTGLALTPDGTSSRPYPICTAAQLQVVIDSPALWSSHFELRRNLDVSGIRGSIGNSTTPFRGTFHGGGHLLSGLVLAGGNDVGLFGRIVGDRVLDGVTDGHVHDLVLQGVNVAGAARVGALVGTSHGGRVERCRVEGGAVTGASQVGGLIGDLAAGSVLSESTSFVAVTGDGPGQVGGLVGRVAISSVQQGTANGLVQGLNGSSAVGGLVGWSSGFVSRSRATGDVSVFGAGQDAGALLGHGTVDHAIDNAWSTGNLAATASGRAGGVAGFSAGTLSTVFSVGSVIGATEVGGIVGRLSGSLTASYATGAVAGADAGGAIGVLVGEAARVFSVGLVTAVAPGSCGGLVGSVSGQGARLADAFTWGDAQCTLASYAGGLAGQVVGGASVARAYSSGEVTAAAESTGGFVGRVSDASVIQACFFDASANSGLPAAGSLQGTSSPQILGLTTSELGNPATFGAAGWDFAQTWRTGAFGTIVLQGVGL
jgi:hypothetical protein